MTTHVTYVKPERMGLGDVKTKAFTVVGEMHPDEAYADLVLQLLRTNDFSELYLEALPVGRVERGYKEELRSRGVVLHRTVDGIFARPGDDLLVYDYNPKKYNRIIDEALGKGITVHGIDVNPKSFRPPEELSEWARYILSTRESPSLILTGAMHAWYRHPPHSEVALKNSYVPNGYAQTPEEAKLDSLSLRLIEQGVPKSDIVVIANPELETIVGIREGIFGIDEPIPYNGAGSQISKWMEDLLYKEVKKADSEGRGDVPGTYEECVERVKSRLPYSDEESYIQWLKQQLEIDPILDYFFFPLDNSRADSNSL